MAGLTFSASAASARLEYEVVPFVESSFAHLQSVECGLYVRHTPRVKIEDFKKKGWLGWCKAEYKKSNRSAASSRLTGLPVECDKGPSNPVHLYP